MKLRSLLRLVRFKQQRADSVQSDLRASMRTGVRAWPLCRFFAGLILRRCYVRIDNPKPTLQPPRGACAQTTPVQTL